MLDLDRPAGARIVTPGQHRDVAGIGEIEPAGVRRLAGQGTVRELPRDAIFEVAPPRIRAGDSERLKRQDSLQGRSATRGGCRAVDPVRGDVGTG